MTTSDTYNGWTNRETWSFMLYVNNDEGLQTEARELVAGLDDPYNRDRVLQDWAETLFTRAGYVDTFGQPWPDALADIASEIGSFYRINFSECVDALLES